MCFSVLYWLIYCLLGAPAFMEVLPVLLHDCYVENYVKTMIVLLTSLHIGWLEKVLMCMWWVRSWQALEKNRAGMMPDLTPFLLQILYQFLANASLAFYVLGFERESFLSA